MQARLAAAELPVVGDVIMDKRGGLEVLDRRGAGAGLLGVAAHRCGGKQANERSVALAAVFGERPERAIEVALEVCPIGLLAKERLQVVFEVSVMLGEKLGKGICHEGPFQIVSRVPKEQAASGGGRRPARRLLRAIRGI